MFNESAILRYEPAPRRFTKFDLPVVPKGSDTPYSLNVDRQRHQVWVTGTNSDSVQRLDIATRTWRFYPLPRKVTFTRDVEFGADGRVFLTNGSFPSWHIEDGATHVHPAQARQRRGAMIRRHGLFLLSCLLAFTAGHMFNYTVILYLQEAVGSDLLSGLGFGLAFGSSIVFGWFAGVLCDRVAPSRVIHAAQAMFLVGLACLWWADTGAAAGLRPAWALVGAFAGGLAWSFVGPARLTTLGQIASATELRPLTILFNLQVLVGFGLAPLVIGLVRSRAGWPQVIGRGRTGIHRFLGPAVRPEDPRQSHAQHEIRLGRHRRRLPHRGRDAAAEALMIATVIAYAMTGPMQILLPKLARQELGLSETQRGAYLGLLALCLIVGGVLALALARRLHHGHTILGGVILGGLSFALLASITTPALSALVLACVGVLGGMVVSLVVSGIQVQAPPAARGRVMSMYAITSQVLPAMSGMAAGVLVGQVGLRPAIAAAGLALAAVAALAALAMPVLWRHPGR